MKYVRKVVLALVVLFCAFYLISRPTEAADAVGGAVDAVASAIEAIFTFFRRLAS